MTLLFLTLVVSAGVAWYSTYLKRFEHEQLIVNRLERFQPYFNNDRMIDFSGSYNKPSDADMSIIAELPGVRWLGLFQAPITDAGLPAIGRLSNLEHLDLSFTAISDAGLPELENLHHLRTLSLVGTHVSEAGVKRLQKALPQCEISK
jgi:Leucine-rich repeat (LRR) protein